MIHRSYFLFTVLLPLATIPAAAGNAIRDDLDPKQQAAVEKVLTLPKTFSQAESFEAMTGGATTRRETNLGRQAYSRFLSNLNSADEQLAALGNA